MKGAFRAKKVALLSLAAFVYITAVGTAGYLMGGSEEGDGDVWVSAGAATVQAGASASAPADALTIGSASGFSWAYYQDPTTADNSYRLVFEEDSQGYQSVTLLLDFNKANMANWESGESLESLSMDISLDFRDSSNSHSDSVSGCFSLPTFATLTNEETSQTMTVYPKDTSATLPYDFSFPLFTTSSWGLQQLIFSGSEDDSSLVLYFPFSVESESVNSTDLDEIANGHFYMQIAFE